MFIDKLNRNTEEKIKVTTDRPLKSIVKTITWRIIGTLDTIFISYILLLYQLGLLKFLQKCFYIFSMNELGLSCVGEECW